MSNILHPFTTKEGKKEWNKLSDENKSKVMESALLEKVRPIMTQQVTNAFINGSEHELEHLYNRFVSYIDEFEIDSIDWLNEVDKLLSYIRLKHVNYIAKQERANQAEQNKTEEITNES